MAASTSTPWEISQEEREEGFVPLFNGVDLEDWAVVGTDAWSIADGVLVCSGEGSGWLRPTRKHDDFVLRLEYKIGEGGNSGVFIRTSEEGRPAFQGMEIQILDDHGEETGKRSTGAIYAAVAPTRNMARPASEWNQVEVIADGPQVTICLNGEQVVDVNLDEHPEELEGETPSTPLKDRLRKGYIGLQNHRSPAWFRNVRIKEL